MENLLKKGQPLFFFTPLLIVLAVAGVWKWIIHPQMALWIQSQIPRINAAQPFVDIKFDRLQVSLIKLQASISNVEIVFKNDLARFKNIRVDHIKTQIDPFDLLIGQIHLNSIAADHVTWDLDEKAFQTEKKAPEDLPLDELFKKLPQIPVDKIRLTDSRINFSLDSKNLHFQTEVGNLTLENLKTRLNLTLANTQSKINFEDNPPVLAQAAASLTLFNDQLKINSLMLNTLESKVKVSGALNQFKKVTSLPTGEITLESAILCDNIRTLYLSLFPQKHRIPSLAGQVDTTGKIAFRGIQNVNAQLELNTSQLSVDHFKFGKARIKAQVKKNQLQIENINLEHPAGMAELNQIEINQEKPYTFKTNLNVKSFNLQKLFISLGLTSIPADLNLTGQAQCQGQLTPPFDVVCTTKSSLSNVAIKPSLKSDFHILKIKQSDVEGTLFANDEDIQFESQIKIGQSTGSAKGVVDFQRGFKIDFDTNQLALKDIESLANLKLAGSLALKGSTWGSSSEGHLETELKAINAEIEDFVLGQFSTSLKYESSHLYFQKVEGRLGQSDYFGNLNFDFGASTLDGKIIAPKLFADDVYIALNKKFSIPFEFSGVGKADAQFSGPFSFWKLKYDLKSSFKQGQIAEEGFERAQINLSSDGEKIKFDDVSIKKVKSSATITGHIDTTEKTPRFNLDIKTNQGAVDEVDHIIRLLPTLSGVLAVQGKVGGDLNSPEVKLDFNTRLVNLEGFDYPPSQGQLEVNKKYLDIKGQVFGRQIQADLRWPWKETDDYSMKLQVRDLNPLLLLPLISLPQPSSEFYSRVNLDVDLKAPVRALNRSEGTIKVSDFFLQRSSHTLKLKQPSTITFNQGLKKMDPIELAGEDSRITAKLLQSSRNDSVLDIDVALKVRILQFLVPFVDALNGNFEAQAQMSLKSGPLQLFGEGQISEGSVQLKGFPTPIENIRTPIEFSQSKIFLNKITAQLGQSDLRGNGQIELKGSKNIPVQLQAVADNLEITFPEKVTTSGRADLQFVGSWLPYSLKVNYKVNRGLVEKDFGQEVQTTGINVQASPFLPPKQFESQAPSLLLDVAVDVSQGVVVKNQLLEGTATGNLNIKGSPEKPMILGKIEIKPGSKIIFKDKPFEVQTATIHFTPSTEINPDIYISALARVSEYDVNLIVQGPSKNLAIKPTSVPPLSESDIFSLLALGMTSTKMDQNLSSEAQQAQTGIEVLAAISNQSVINKKIQQTLGLNIQLAPSVDSTRNIAVPKVVVSKQLLKKLNASYAKPLSGDDEEHEIKLQYLFNPNWSGILNYQNRDSATESGSIQNKNTNESGIFGGDLEYKKEFKWK